jgi:hypothetical protein
VDVTKNFGTGGSWCHFEYNTASENARIEKVEENVFGMLNRKRNTQEHKSITSSSLALSPSSSLGVGPAPSQAANAGTSYREQLPFLLDLQNQAFETDQEMSLH